MENQFCALLRGVNVKGTSMKMEDLKAAFIKMGFTNIKTILATGNVIFKTEKALEAEALKRYIEEELSSCFEYDSHVFLRDTGDMKELLDCGASFPAPKDCHHYTLVCDDQEILEELKELFNNIPHEPQEEFYVTSGYAFWIVPKGSTLSSEFGNKVLGKKRYKSSLTSRNKNTLEKIYTAMTAEK